MTASGEETELETQRCEPDRLVEIRDAGDAAGETTYDGAVRWGAESDNKKTT